MRRSIFACGLLLALAGISSAVAAAAGVTGNAAAADTTTTTTPTSTTTTTTPTQKKTDYWNARAAQAQATTRHWQTVTRGRPPLQGSQIESANSPGAANQLWQTWHQR